MSEFTLENDGDSIERKYFQLFVAEEFPSYETFWQSFIVPMTNRPSDIHFKSDQELAELGRGDHDISISQLNYSVFRHLARVYDIKTIRPLDPESLIEGMVRLVGAQDVAFDLLERYLHPHKYDPWLSVGKRGLFGSKEARREWQKNNNYPLQDIRDYRNHLVHGRIMPGVISGDIYVPRIGVEDRYFDWRIITDNSKIGDQIGSDLISTYDVMLSAWDQTISYIEAQWHQHLN